MPGGGVSRVQMPQSARYPDRGCRACSGVRIQPYRRTQAATGQFAGGPAHGRPIASARPLALRVDAGKWTRDLGIQRDAFPLAVACFAQGTIVLLVREIPGAVGLDRAPTADFCFFPAIGADGRRRAWPDGSRAWPLQCAFCPRNGRGVDATSNRRVAETASCRGMHPA